MGRLLTQKEFARRKGVTPQYVNKLVREGRIRLVDGKVDPKQASEAIATRRHAGKKAYKAPKKKTAVAKKKAPAKPAPCTVYVSAAKAESKTKTLTDARLHNEVLKGKQMQLELDERMGKLLPADEVIAAEQRKNGNIRMRLRRVARSVASLVARMTSAVDIEQYLLGEIDAQLNELSADPLGLKPVEPEEPVQASAETVPAAVLVQAAAVDAVPGEL
jgi:hypothetical protein